MSTPPETTYEVPSVDLTKLPLTPEEGFVLSRLMGRRLSVGQLEKEGVLPGGRLPGIMASLVGKGALVALGVGQTNTATMQDDPYSGMVFSASAMMEPADLSDEQRKRILFYEAKLSDWTHYKLLGAKRLASGSDLKAAYFKVSKEFHPDAFFRKNLGSFKERLERIFKAMKAAYDVLNDPAARAAYDATVIVELTPEEEQEVARLAAEKRKEMDAREREARTQERLREQRLKRNPAVERIRRARDLIKLAEEATSRGRLEEAATHARLALTFDESDAAKALVKPFLHALDRQQALTTLRKVMLASQDAASAIPEDELVALAGQAADAAALVADAAVLVEAARVHMRLKRLHRAGKLAQQAVDVAPTNLAALEVLSEVAVADDKWAVALRASERWLALDPTADRAKQIVKEAKRRTS